MGWRNFTGSSYFDLEASLKFYEDIILIAKKINVVFKLLTVLKKANKNQQLILYCCNKGENIRYGLVWHQYIFRGRFTDKNDYELQYCVES